MKIHNLAFLALAAAGVAGATSINLSTGAVTYTITLDSNGGTDANFTGTAVTSPSLPGGSFTHVGTITDSDSVSSSIWVAPNSDESDETSSVTGSTTYQVTFNLPAFSIADLVMSLAADDYVSSVTLNGFTIFTPTTGTGSQTATGMWTAPEVGTASSSSHLNVGSNTLVFVVPNNGSDGTGSCCGPTALLVAADVTYTASTTPEPATFGLVGAGLLGAGLVRLRKRNR